MLYIYADDKIKTVGFLNLCVDRILTKQTKLSNVFESVQARSHIINQILVLGGVCFIWNVQKPNFKGNTSYKGESKKDRNLNFKFLSFYLGFY